ncbi:MAG: diguanylate cyclase [Lachnospiraceae bacterium]|nr:diguanylate cyclase [Lachnospiraceae bacterium]
MNSLQKKFTITVIIEILFICLVLGGTGSLMINRVVEKSAMQVLELTCQEHGMILNNLLNEVKQSVDIMANMTLKELTSMNRFVKDASYQQNFEKSMENKFWEIATNTKEVVSFYMRWNYELPLSYDGFFYSRIKRNDSLLKYPPTDIAAYAKDDVEHVGWYHIPVENRKPTWLAPYHNQNNDLYMISYVVPLYAEDTLLGVVGMDIDFSDISATISNISFFEDGFAYLVDENNNILYHPSLSQGEPRPEKEASSFETEIRLTNGCTLVTHAHRENVNKEGDLFIRFLGFSTIFFLLAASCITILMIQHIVRPLKELTLAAVKIADGDFDVEINCQSTDEIGTLAKSFQKTAASLKEYVGYINGLAYKDSLTGIRNNMAYQEYVSTLKAKMTFGNIQFAIALFDANGLKSTNDTYGHAAGNLLIINSAKYICNIFKHSPVFRIGGDEFVAILENEDYQNRAELYNSFYERMSEITVSIKNQELPISIALGIAEYNRDEDFLYENVFARADHTMYQKKREMKE